VWLRTVDIGAHQACCPLLQAVFMTAKAPTTRTVAVRKINTEVFIATSLLRAPHLPPADFCAVQNEPNVNVPHRAPRSARRRGRTSARSKHQCLKRVKNESIKENAAIATTMVDHACRRRRGAQICSKETSSAWRR
jgi:hypothetical protein